MKNKVKHPFIIAILALLVLPFLSSPERVPPVQGVAQKPRENWLSSFSQKLGFQLLLKSFNFNLKSV